MIAHKQVRILLPTFLNLFFYKHYMKKCIKNNVSMAKRYPTVQRRLNHILKTYSHIVYFQEGSENRPDTQCVYTPNHTSMLDPVVMVDQAKRPLGFVTKKENYKLPKLIDLGMDFVRNVPLDRDNVRSAIKSFQQVDKILEENPDMDYCIFPEGTRSYPDKFELGEFHHGSFKIATRRNLPIVPVVIYGTERAFDPHFHYRKYPVQIAYLKPILPEEYEDLSTVEIAEMVKGRIDEKLKEFKAKDKELIQTLNHYSDKKLAKKLAYPEGEKKRY